MTDADFQALIDAANARLANGIENSFNKAMEDTRASFRECKANLNARFEKAAQDLGIDLVKPPESGAEYNLTAPRP